MLLNGLNAGAETRLPRRLRTSEVRISTSPSFLGSKLSTEYVEYSYLDSVIMIPFVRLFCHKFYHYMIRK